MEERNRIRERRVEKKKERFLEGRRKEDERNRVEGKFEGLRVFFWGNNKFRLSEEN
jgi:hypothetical protein